MIRCGALNKRGLAGLLVAPVACYGAAALGGIATTSSVGTWYGAKGAKGVRSEWRFHKPLIFSASQAPRRVGL